MKRRGVMLILSSPSGAGKTTLSRRLLACEPKISLSVSATTRPPRPEEKHGVDYFFLSEEEFQKREKAGAFLETARVFDHWYGTPAEHVNRTLEAGGDMLFDIDWQGAQQLMEKSPAVTKVFLLPPSAEALYERLCKRAQDSPDVVKNRMKNAANEVSHYAEYDYVLVNREVEETLAVLRSILHAARAHREKQSELSPFVDSLGEALRKLTNL